MLGHQRRSPLQDLSGDAGQDRRTMPWPGDSLVICFVPLPDRLLGSELALEFGVRLQLSLVFFNGFLEASHFAVEAYGVLIFPVRVLTQPDHLVVQISQLDQK